MKLANKKGKQRPVVALVYGPEGIGKSTFGSHAPNPVFIGAEKGMSFLDVESFEQPKSFEDVIECLDSLHKETHAFETVVVDSLDWLEPMVWDKVLREKAAV